MGSITENILNSVKQITKPWEIKTGKTLVEIERVSDGEILSFANIHDWNNNQILHELNKQRHYHGRNGSGNWDSPINIPGATAVVSPNTGLSNGDSIKFTITMNGGNTLNGSTTGVINYNIPLGTFAPPTALKNSFRGNFVSAGGIGTVGVAEEAEFMRVTTRVEDDEFANQNALEMVGLPHVTYVGNRGFEQSRLEELSIEEAITIGDRAFFAAKLERLLLPKATTIGEQAFTTSHLVELFIPEADTIGDRAFDNIINDPGTTVTMKSKFNTPSEKGRIFGYNGGSPRDWDKISFTWV